MEIGTLVLLVIVVRILYSGWRCVNIVEVLYAEQIYLCDVIISYLRCEERVKHNSLIWLSYLFLMLRVLILFYLQGSQSDFIMVAGHSFRASTRILCTEVSGFHG